MCKVTLDLLSKEEDGVVLACETAGEHAGYHRVGAVRWFDFGEEGEE